MRRSTSTCVTAQGTILVPTSAFDHDGGRDGAHEAGDHGRADTAQLANKETVIDIPMEHCSAGRGGRDSACRSRRISDESPQTSRVHVLAGKTAATIVDALTLRLRGLPLRGGRCRRTLTSRTRRRRPIVAAGEPNWSFTCGADGLLGGSPGRSPWSSSWAARTIGDAVYHLRLPGSSTRRRS